MSNIISPHKAGKLEQLKEALYNFQHGVARDMGNFWRTMTNLSIIVDAHTKLLGEDRVKAEVDRFVAEKQAEAGATPEGKVNIEVVKP